AGRSGHRTTSGATTTRTRAVDTSGDGRACSAARCSSGAPGKEQRLDPVGCGGELVLLDGARGIHVLRAHLRALAHERALPEAVVLREDLQSLRCPVIPRVHVVALGERDGGRANEARLEPIDGTGGVAQHAVDAHAELLVDVELFWRLEVLALARGLLLLAGDPGPHALELSHEV